MARRQDEQRGGAPLIAEGKSDAEVKLILYHWTYSFSSQKVKALAGRAAQIGFQHLDSSRWVPPGEARPPRPPMPQPLRAGAPCGAGERLIWRSRENQSEMERP